MCHISRFPISSYFTEKVSNVFSAVINKIKQTTASEITFDYLIGAEGGVVDCDGVRRLARLWRDAVFRGHVHTLANRSSGWISRYSGPNLEQESDKEHGPHVNRDPKSTDEKTCVTDQRGRETES